MKPTGALRWLEFDLGAHHGEHPTAHVIPGTNVAIVLQQEFKQTYAFSEEFVPGGKTEWRDIPVVR